MYTIAFKLVCEEFSNYLFLDEQGICQKTSTIDKRGVPIALHRGCIMMEDCPSYAFWKPGPGVCTRSIYQSQRTNNQDCLKCDYFVGEPARFKKKPWYKCVPRRMYLPLLMYRPRTIKNVPN